MLLDYIKARDMLGRYGISSVKSGYVDSPEQAVKFSEGKPLALKVLSEKALHKSKSGVVKLGLLDPDDIREAFSELSSKASRLRPYKILAQRMAPPGVEAIIGGRKDPQFGQTILLGMGGIYVEAFRDFSLRICPITRYDSVEMIHQLRSAQVITHNGKSEKMLSGLLLGVSRLLGEHPEITELDLNPVIVREDGYEAVDLRIIEE